MTENETRKEIGEVKSLRWLANMFPFTKVPKDETDKMTNAINVYCTAGADKIEELQELLDCANDQIKNQSSNNYYDDNLDIEKEETKKLLTNIIPFIDEISVSRIMIDVIGALISFETNEIYKFLIDVSEENLNKLFDTAKLIRIREEGMVSEKEYDSKKIKQYFVECVGMEVSDTLNVIYNEIASCGIHNLEMYKEKILRYTDICIKIADLHKKLISE